MKPWEIVKKYGAYDSYMTDGFICAVFPYLPEKISEGNISLYARGQDYHIWVKEILNKAVEELQREYPDNHFKAYTDTSPHDEVMIAYKCGLGALGKNRLIITDEYGSYVFIGIIETDLECTAEPRETRHCIGCNACVKACPGGAISENGVCSDKCLSHITQKRADLDENEAKMIKNHSLIWGCDTCQLVCPMNKGVKHSNIEEIIHTLTPQDVDISDKQFRKKYADFAFSFRGVKPLKRNLEIKKM